MTKRYLLLALLTGMLGAELSVADEGRDQSQNDQALVQRFVSTHCLDCHDQQTRTAEFDLESLLKKPVTSDIESWELVVSRLRSRQMPPADAERPQEAEFVASQSALERLIDHHAIQHPAPGRTETLRRLNRTEYQNSIRDLLHLDIDATTLLPPDESSHGFDNITVGELTPALMSRYISAAQRISRQAIGGATRSPGGDTIRIRADITQEKHVDGLPLGTRGGALIPYTFPRDGVYEIRVRLARDRNEVVEGLKGSHELEILLDRARVGSFTVSPPGDQDFSKVDAHLVARVRVDAGPRKLGVTFLKNPNSLLETKRQPFDAHFNMHRHPRLTPAIFQVSVTGPYDQSDYGDTPSRRRIFVRRPSGPEDEDQCAREILSKLMMRAYRRPVQPEDLERPMAFFREGRDSGDFDAGIQVALSSILITPSFLFRVEQEPEGLEPGTPYQINDLELASRLSFFLWSSLPDDELLDHAIAGRLHQPEFLDAQVDRMLKDKRSNALVTNFASQWLYLRNLDSITPDLRLFPDFDDNLRQAFRTETELFFSSIKDEDRSVLDLLKADYTFLNERLARHYGVPHVYGSRFRRVQLSPGSHRGGLLRQGSILTVTSYATRTSPVIRGHWILKNLMSSEPPPPPADVPALKDNTVAANLSVRERLAEHRANAACASCHNLMDPVGFSLEHYDAVGRWRETEFGKPVDATGGLPDGRKFSGVQGLEEGLLSRPEIFVGTMAEKLFVYGLGRGLEYYDAPAIRKVVRESASDDYTFSSIIQSIVRSRPFQMRSSQ